MQLSFFRLRNIFNTPISGSHSVSINFGTSNGTDASWRSLAAVNRANQLGSFGYQPFWVRPLIMLWYGDESLELLHALDTHSAITNDW
jgi:hypothetical protein